MKSMGFIIILIFMTGCDPYGFGFKKNPAYVLNEVFNAVLNQDIETFVDFTAKEALCIYGNETGLQFLKNHLHIDTHDLEFIPQVLESTHMSAPKYVGFWAYYFKRYEIELLKKSTTKNILKVIVDCHFGTIDEKDAAFINLKPAKYKTKDCRLVKIISPQLATGRVSDICQILGLNLQGKI